MTFTQLNQLLIVCVSIGLVTACTPKSDQQQSAATTQDHSASAPTSSSASAHQPALILRTFAASNDDAHDIAVLDTFYEKIDQLRIDVEADLKNLQQQGNLSNALAIQRQRDYMQSALHMLKALNLRTEQGRYIQGLLYQYWESQAQQTIASSSATTEHPIRLESDAVGATDYLSAQAQFKNWKLLQTKTFKNVDS